MDQGYPGVLPGAGAALLSAQNGICGELWIGCRMDEMWAQGEKDEYLIPCGSQEKEEVYEDSKGI